MLSSEQFKSLLAHAFTEEIRSYEFEIKSYPMRSDTRPDASWRDHLLRTFSIRLKNSIQHKADSALINELSQFVGHLEQLDRTANLYCWQAQTSKGGFSGWATDLQIIHTSKYPSE